MAGLCEGGNEPSGSLKAICNYNIDFQESFLATDTVFQKPDTKNNTGKNQEYRSLSKGEVSDTSVVSVHESNANVSNSAKISGMQPVTSTEEETGVTRTGIQQVQQAQQNKTSMQANGNSGH
ncbi:hypothetical protein ANN_12508 [Periplaneta americana]|uniref:Uncharacterized protein n=1 Tax=Periplaneta americana TaxID=6978 RepID=A0ABQ8THR9_PERAM|nr:hypothetical protein ANN_12508 [Periplaneta americana]